MSLPVCSFNLCVSPAMQSVVLLLQLQEGPRLNDAQSGFRASSRSAYKKKGGRGSQAYSSMHGFATQTLPPVDPAEQELNCAAPWY